MTGYAYITLINGKYVDAPVAGQVECYPFCVFLEGLCLTWTDRLTIVSERFTISERTIRASRDGVHDALDTIGVLRYMSRRHTGKEVKFQQPDAVMALLTDEKLKAKGWYKPGQDHANDALRHMGWALARRKLIKLS